MAGVFTTTVQAQSASKVIERHIEAIGGEKAVERIVSTELTGTVSASDGRSGVFTQRTKRPYLFSVSMSLGDIMWSAGFNGRSAWQDDTAGAQTLFGPGPLASEHRPFTPTRVC
jgi:hypothetical protein